MSDKVVGWGGGGHGVGFCHFFMVEILSLVIGLRETTRREGKLEIVGERR